ncbi:unnamed protein product [Rotaria socialis]|uniref:protein-tyrosine-phosphatase n=1 Tax=Rotaria socialis TaxID=392032 RepID=A0A818TUD6_9BILA|nr:unnamed protein product [Rotaria socialis]CAF3682247.1 unnamed protein product [Rotaria socialis]CAF4655057.1 unnamed protein product [Rotaria socialis]CAF4809230.1 unnamed protein product [Rotaria socialis]
MPITRAVERNSLSLPSSPQKSYNISSHLSTQYEDADSMEEKRPSKRTSDSPRKNSGSVQKNATSASTAAQPSRRQFNHDALPPTRGRSNTDVQSTMSASNNIKQQQANIGGSGSDKTVNHNYHSHPPTGVPSKLKCMLPTTACQPGYVTPSKLFNMMGYGLENQYLFMLAHYLYIIDCRSREKFNESHIITAIHWEDALNGTVYISIVERFSEIILYDDKGIFFNTTTEMRRVYNRFATPGTKACLTLSGGFEAFRTFFPFICTQTDVRSTVDREKFLTIYPSVVIDNQLYLGTGHQATNWKVIRDLKLTHIINISVEHQCVFPDKIKYLHLQLEDMEDVLLKDRFDETIHFMDSAFQNPSNRILVHCNLGISRSTTLILSYLMKTYNATLLEAFKYLRHRRPIVCPNVGFLRQLIDYEFELFSHAYSDPNDPIFH